MLRNILGTIQILGFATLSFIAIIVILTGFGVKWADKFYDKYFQ